MIFNFELCLSFLINKRSASFNRNRSITFWIILITDSWTLRLTDSQDQRQRDRPTRVKQYLYSKHSFGRCNYKHTQFCHFESISISVKAEAIIEKYQLIVYTKVNMTTLNLNVKYIKTTSCILTYHIAIKINASQIVHIF